MITQERFINPKEIILPKDYKPDNDLLSEMIKSIKENGRLLHSPCIKDDKTIVYGKLRVLAAVQASLDIIRCDEVLSGLEPDVYIELSLTENLRRHNLPWYEIVLHEKELHELRRRQAGEDEIGKRGQKAAWGLRETAQELRISLGVLSEDLRLADAILADPSLKKITDKTTAKKVIFENIKRLHQEIGACSPTNIEVNVCHLGHSDVILRLYPDNFFDACITDPPWLEFKDSSLVRDEFTLPVFNEVYRVLKQNSFLYMFVSTQDWFYYFEELKSIGFSIQKFPLIWHKKGVLTYGRKSWEYQRDYEPILLAAKGSPAVVDSMLSSVMSYNVVPSQKLIHPNEKPVELINTLLEHCSYDGSIVLDPFAGSFVIPYCAKKLGRRYVAIEREPKYFQKGEERLK